MTAQPAGRTSRASIELRRLRQMLRIRRFEEKCAELYSAEKIRGFLHLYIGEEAIAVGVMRALTPEDAVVATYREHGHAIARGIPCSPSWPRCTASRKAAAAAAAARCTSSMPDPILRRQRHRRRRIAARRRAGAGRPHAAAAESPPASSAKARSPRARFTRASILPGFGSCPCFSSARTICMRWGRRSRAPKSQTDIYRKAASYRVPARSVDGMDPVAVEAAARAVRQVRAGQGPRFLECRTYRFRAHSMFDPELYRDKAEVEQWRKRDPIHA